MSAALPRIEAGVIVGPNCSIDASCLLERDVVVGTRVTLRYGIALPRGTTLEDDVFVGANAAFTSDDYTADTQRTIVRRGATIGANATLAGGITIGERAVVRPAAFVTSNVPPLAIVEGNPARIVGYNGAQTQSEVLSAARPLAGRTATLVAGVSLHRLPSAADMRGQLSYAEVGEHLPFPVERFFLVYGVESREVRGEHAHRKLHQFLMCVHGQCSVVADDGRNRQEFVLDDPTVGLHVPPLVWAVQYKHTPDAVLLVLASHHYDPSDYIRDYSQFLAELSGAGPEGKEKP